jgi:hypothetical protein
VSGNALYDEAYFAAAANGLQEAVSTHFMAVGGAAEAVGCS